MKKSVKKLTAALLMLVMVVSLFGCETKTLDVKPTAAPTEAAPVETEAPTEATLGEDAYFDMDGLEDNTDLSKYDEKDVTVQRDQNGNIHISDGTQNGQDQYFTDTVPEGQQMPVEPGDIEIDTSNTGTCYLSIDCSTILYNMENLADGKDILVPADGMILYSTPVTFYFGESVFDVLQRVTRENLIHMSSRFTPIYNSAYIEAIGNLYEFDCGSGSGWMYNVNGWYPNYGVSRYVVQDGDVIEFNYTCDLGRDLGAEVGD